MIKKILLLVFFLFISFGYSQYKQLSPTATISIITYGPGEQLYEKFGHSSIRVTDRKNNIDLNYNYGIFDFDAPNFYLKFIKGFMNYKLVKYPFYYALKSARKDKRWMKEQVLNLTDTEKNAFYTYLENNVLPENASYFYDPYFDNCATKPRDILKSILGNKLQIPQDTISHKKTLRELMNHEIHWNTWGSFGINIALGRLDEASTTESAMYLPDYVFKAFKASTIIDGQTTKPLIKKTKTLLDYKESAIKSDTTSPLLITVIIAILGVSITVFDFKRKKRTKWFDFTLFLATGLVGALIVFLWFFTNHSTAPNNLNFLWAFAPNIFIAFKLAQKNPPKWISKYLVLVLILMLCIPILWLFRIQLFSICLIPIHVLLVIRYFFLQKTLNT